MHPWLSECLEIGLIEVLPALKFVNSIVDVAAKRCECAALHPKFSLNLPQRRYILTDVASKRDGCSRQNAKACQHDFAHIAVCPIGHGS